MDPQLQRAYDALQQADAAGNKEDAQKIADYIRELQTQQQNKVMLEAGEESMMRNPMAAGAAGAVAGPVAGKVLETAYGPKGVPTVTPGAAPSMAGAPGQKYAAKTGYGAGTGETVREVVEEFKKQEGPLGKGKVTSKITGGPLGGPAAMEQIAAKEADAARFAQMRAANQMAAQKASSVPGRIAQATAGKMPLLLKSAAGAGAGMQGADAYNRFQEGDYLGSLLGGIGAAGSAASLIPHPVTRIGGTAIGMGAGALNAYIDYLKSKSQPQAAQPQPQGMAAGGLAGYAKGKSVDEEKPFVGYPQIKRTNRNPNFKPQVDKYTGMLDALIGGSKREDLSVLDPKQTEYSEAYDKYEPAGIALMGAPFLGGPIKSLGKALAPKAGQAAEDLLARQGLISYATPRAKMSPGMSFGNPAPIEAPMLRPSGSGSLLPKVSDPYIAHYQDILPQVRLKNPKPDSRMSRLESDPRAHQAIQDAIKAGVNIDPKLADWYGTNALLTGMLNEGRQFGNFEQFMKHMASSSQRNPVPQQNKMGSYLAYLENMGQIGDPGTKLALPKGYGSLAQGDIVNRSQRIAAGEYPFDDAIKLGKFYKSYMGYHPNNAVVDVIGTRVPTMATKDPDWLVSRLQIGTDAKGNKQIINPKAMYESGELSMEEALKRPGFWEAAPKLTGEYAGLEDMWKMGSKNAKQPYAGSGQALGWYGSAGLEDSAGLKSKPMTWVESLEKSARDRAAITGENPLDVMNKVLKGTGHFKEGGSTTPAWQRKEGKSPSGGLNALGRASYKRETGGELKAPQPEGGSRKKSFCARMGGMKKKLTSSETANDPDSRINKALRKWKC
jgi:hypothetical protein